MSAIRANQVDRLNGGVSQLLKRLLHTRFAPPFNLKNGLHLDLSLGTPRLAFGEVFAVLQDLSAHKLSTLCKGHSGHKLCPLCQNVVSHKSKWLPDVTGRRLQSTCLEIDECVVHKGKCHGSSSEVASRCARGRGTFVVEMSELLSRLDRHAFGRAQLGACLSNLRWPGGYESGAKVCCDGKFGGSNGELLSSAPVIALYLRGVVREAGVCEKE
eukprot:9142711-Pyramimonas_sp.AAC.1